MIWSVIWYYILAAFTAADIITTKMALMLGGREVNPFLINSVDHITEIKIGFMLLVIGIVIVTERSHKGSGWIPVAAGTIVTFAAVLSNIITLSGMI